MGQHCHLQHNAIQFNYLHRATSGEFTRLAGKITHAVQRGCIHFTNVIEPQFLFIDFAEESHPDGADMSDGSSCFVAFLSGD